MLVVAYFVARLWMCGPRDEGNISNKKKEQKESVMQSLTTCSFTIKLKKSMDMELKK